MAHINLPEGMPGILGPLTAYPDSANDLCSLAQSVLRGPSSLSTAEREIIATHVSIGNACDFCTNSHAATARHLLGEDSELVDDILRHASSPRIDPKLRALLEIAEKVRRDGRLVTEADIRQAQEAGADHRAIHDTVLIAAMFCMYNRYVDGLGTWTPEDPALYDEMGARLAVRGYAGD